MAATKKTKTPKKKSPTAAPAAVPNELHVAKDQLATVRAHLQVLLGYLQPQWISDSVRTSLQALVRFGRDGTV